MNFLPVILKEFSDKAQQAAVSCRRLLTVFSVLFCLAVLCMGCPRQTMYGVVVANDGTEYIPDAGITYGKHTLRFGNVMPNCSKGYGTVTLPIPDEVTISWKQKSGQEFEKQVLVKSLIPRPSRFTGDIWVRLQDDGSVTLEIKK